MKRKIGRKASLLLISLLASCSGLSTMTSDVLTQAESKWNQSKPQAYHLVIDMKGDRVPAEQFDVTVEGGKVATLKRDGREIKPTPDQDYSMDGLFRMLQQELVLAEKPSLLGAPEGYSSYPMARFDSRTGRLLEYRRTVGGTSNTIDIRVSEYNPL